jgi:hypothetical protein
MASTDWDADDNSTPAPRQPEPSVSDGFSGYSGHSGYTQNFLRLDDTIDTTSTLTFGSTQTDINPSQSFSVSSPLYVSPISYSFHETHWLYTLVYALNVLCSPWLIIWSKITGRPAGFRFKNPNYRRIRVIR